MKILSLEFKNFASYGNRIQRIEFDKDSGELYQILGDNGSGKSSIAKAITYLCYGKVESVSLKDLPNRINGSMWGKIKMECRGKRVEVERGISPNIFSVKINGTEYDVAGKANLQEYLESEIYEIPYHVFKNVIILSVNDFKSFITMSPSDKKQIVDRIFGFSAINSMREIVKQRRREIADEVRGLDEELKTLGESIESVKHKLSEFEQASKDRNAAQIKSLKERLVELNQSRVKLLDANETVRGKIVDKSELVKSKSTTRQTIISDIKSHERALRLYENSTCPTCGGSLNSAFHKKAQAKHTESLVLLQEEHKTVERELIEAEEQVSTMRDKHRQIISKTSELETKMQQIKHELMQLAESKGQDSQHLHDLIRDFSMKRDASSRTKNAVESKDNYLALLETIVGEDGIKNLAVKSILPSLNNHVMLMGKEMGIPFGIVFDNKFNCTLHHLGEEVSPKSLSTGEKKKVDFVIIMSLIKMIKTRFPGLNILFLDEIFSSIDASGVHHIISILHQTIKKIGLNTFVINHTVLPTEFFDKKIEITKDGGFSEFTVEEIS